MVDRRLNMTDIVMNTLEELSGRDNVAILPAIRTDTSVVKAGRHRKFLVGYDPKSKALARGLHYSYRRVAPIVAGA